MPSGDDAITDLHRIGTGTATAGAKYLIWSLGTANANYFFASSF